MNLNESFGRHFVAKGVQLVVAAPCPMLYDMVEDGLDCEGTVGWDVAGGDIGLALVVWCGASRWIGLYVFLYRRYCICHFAYNIVRSAALYGQALSGNVLSELHVVIFYFMCILASSSVARIDPDTQHSKPKANE